MVVKLMITNSPVVWWPKMEKPPLRVPQVGCKDSLIGAAGTMRTKPTAVLDAFLNRPSLNLVIIQESSTEYRYQAKHLLQAKQHEISE